MNKVQRSDFEVIEKSWENPTRGISKSWKIEKIAKFAKLKIHHFETEKILKVEKRKNPGIKVTRKSQATQEYFDFEFESKCDFVLYVIDPFASEASHVYTKIDSEFKLVSFLRIKILLWQNKKKNIYKKKFRSKSQFCSTKIENWIFININDFEKSLRYQKFLSK